MNKLEEICAAKREIVAARRLAISDEALTRAARTQTLPRGFEAALRAKAASGYALIAEIKKASPSKGLIRADFRPAEHAAAYEAGGGQLGLDAVHEVPVKMQAVLGRARMTVSELMQMAPGRVVELDRKVGEPVDIFVSNRLIARGEVVLIDRALGVTLTEIVHEDD